MSNFLKNAVIGILFISVIFVFTGWASAGLGGMAIGKDTSPGVSHSQGDMKVGKQTGPGLASFSKVSGALYRDPGKDVYTGTFTLTITGNCGYEADARVSIKHPEIGATQMSISPATIHTKVGSVHTVKATIPAKTWQGNDLSMKHVTASLYFYAAQAGVDCGGKVLLKEMQLQQQNITSSTNQQDIASSVGQQNTSQNATQADMTVGKQNVPELVASAQVSGSLYKDSTGKVDYSGSFKLEITGDCGHEYISQIFLSHPEAGLLTLTTTPMTVIPKVGSVHMIKATIPAYYMTENWSQKYLTVKLNNLATYESVNCAGKVLLKEMQLQKQDISLNVTTGN